MRFAPLAIAAALLASVPFAAPGPAQAASLYITAGTGTDTATISEGNPHSWTFTTAPPNTSFQAGVFALQMEAGTTFGIRMDLQDDTNTTLGSVTLSSQEVTDAGGNATSYTRIIFHMPIALADATTYTLTLAVADDPQEVNETGSFSLRGALNELQFVLEEDATDVAVASGPLTVETPEPAAALLLATALLGLAATRRPRAA